MIENNEINGKCSNCGRCCGDFICVTKQEIRKIAEYLRANKGTKAFFPRTEGKTLMASCPFRDPTARKCAIYPVRPKICRTFRCGMGDEAAQRNFDRQYARDGATCLISLNWVFLGDPRLCDGMGIPRVDRAEWLGFQPELL